MPSIAAPSIRGEMHLDAAVMGFVFSAFSRSYFAASIPAGIMVDRFGNHVIYFLARTFWSLFTRAQGFASSVAGFIGLRVRLGLSEAPCFSNDEVETICAPGGAILVEGV